MTDTKQFFHDFIDLMKKHSTPIPGKGHDASDLLKCAGHILGQCAASSSAPMAAIEAILHAFEAGLSSKGVNAMLVKAVDMSRPEKPENKLEATGELGHGEEYLHEASDIDQAFVQGVTSMMIHHSAITNPDIMVGVLGWSIGAALKELGCGDIDLAKKSMLVNLDIAVSGEPQQRIN